MPEGHTLHRLALELTQAFGDRVVHTSSPQGRFLSGAATIDRGRVVDASAHGKHLFVTIARRRQRQVLHVHLGLYGRFDITLIKGGVAPTPVGQVRLRMQSATAVADLRGPTRCELLDPGGFEHLVARLGPDPLHSDADGDAAYALVSVSRTSIAALLMRQDVLAGVGNVYRAEVLFRHGIDPFLAGREVPHSVWRLVWDDLVALMSEGVRTGSIDTVRDHHLPRAMDRPARMDRHGGEVYVYRRAGEPCLLCGASIRVQVLAGRNLFWCPMCQPAS